MFAEYRSLPNPGVIGVPFGAKIGGTQSGSLSPEISTLLKSGCGSGDFGNGGSTGSGLGDGKLGGGGAKSDAGKSRFGNGGGSLGGDGASGGQGGSGF